MQLLAHVSSDSPGPHAIGVVAVSRLAFLPYHGCMTLPDFRRIASGVNIGPDKQHCRRLFT